MMLARPDDVAESTPDELTCVHNGTVELPLGTLVEVCAGDDEFWYGEINGYNNKEPLVTYIEADEDKIYSFQQETYEAPKESINRFIPLVKGKKRECWKLFGFVYMGRFEIVPVEEMNSDESDEEWEPKQENESDDDEIDEDSDEEDEEDEEDEVDSEDEADADDMVTESESEGEEDQEKN